MPRGSDFILLEMGAMRGEHARSELNSGMNALMEEKLRYFQGGKKNIQKSNTGKSNVGENFKKGGVNRAKHCRQVVNKIPRLEGIDKGSSLVSVLQRDSLTSSGAHDTGRDPRSMDLEGLQDCSQLSPTQLQRDDFLSSRVLKVFL